jgi:hypothetical protein
VLDGFDREVDVEIGPVEVVRSRAFDVEDGAIRGFRKPRELCKRHEELAIA